LKCREWRRCSRAGNDDIINSARPGCLRQPKRLANQTLPTIAQHRLPHAPRDRHSQARVGQIVCRGIHLQIGIGHRAARRVHPRIIRRSPQAVGGRKCRGDCFRGAHKFALHTFRRKFRGEPPIEPSDRGIGRLKSG
jgi:hypothetical protein